MALDTADIEARLEAIAERLAECRAAAATAADGDAGALLDLGREVDAIATDVAALKAALSTPTLDT